MKKILVALFAFFMIFALVGCNKKEPTETKQPTVVPSEKTEVPTEPQEVKVSSIDVEFEQLMFVGDNQILVVTVYPNDAANKALDFVSSNKSVVSVDADGLVKALNPGNAVITVSSKDGSDVKFDCEIEVKPILVDEIFLSGEDQVKVGNTITLNLTIGPENAENLNVVWSSSDENVATVNAGKVTGVAPGTCEITVTAQDESGLSTSLEITVLEDDGPVEPTDIILVINGQEYHNKETVNLEVESSYPFSFKYEPADKNVLEGVDYSLYNEKFCVIEKGAIKATAIGQVAFQVYSSECDLEVMFVINITEIYYAPTEVVITTDALFAEVGGTAQFSASILPAEAHQGITWSVSDETIATIDANGLLTGIKAGNVTVIAAPADGEDINKQYDFEIKEKTTVDVSTILVDPSYTATGSEITVGEKTFVIGKNAFNSLASAIEAALEGTTIKVAAGEYAEDAATLAYNDVTIIGPNAEVNPVENHERTNEAKIQTCITLAEGVKNFTLKGCYLFGKAGVKASKDDENIELSYNVIYKTSQDGIVSFSDSKGVIKDVSLNYNYSEAYVAYRFLYAWNVDGFEIIGNELWGNNEIQYVCDIINVQGKLEGKVIITDNLFDKLYQSVLYNKGGVGELELIFRNNKISNVTCCIVDIRDMVETAACVNTVEFSYNTLNTCGRFVPGNTGQADWGMVRVSTAGYKDSDTLTVNVNYNKFIDAESDDDGLFVYWNRGKSSSLAKFLGIVNLDNNYFNGKTSANWPSDYFGNQEASIQNVYTNADEVPAYVKEN